MAIPTFIAAGGYASDTSGAASTTPTPPTHQANDILLIQVFNEGNRDVVTATEGWTRIVINQQTRTGAWFWKRASAPGTTGATITASGGPQFAICYAIRGCITTGTPYEDATTAIRAAGTSLLSTEITTTGADRLAMNCLIMEDNSLISNSPPANWNQDDLQNSTLGIDNSFLISSTEAPSVTTITQATMGTTASSEIFQSLTLAWISGEAPSGYANKVLGIIGGKVNGVETGNIAKVNGV